MGRDFLQDEAPTYFEPQTNTHNQRTWALIFPSHGVGECFFNPSDMDRSEAMGQSSVEANVATCG